MRRLNLLVAGCILAAATQAGANPSSTWSSGSKTGIGTAYADYSTPPASTVWFSLAHGVLTETMYGMIHEAQLKDLQFAVKGAGFSETELADTDGDTFYLDTDAQGRPLALAYRLVNKSKAGHYEIEKHVFTDPASNTVFLRAIFRAAKGKIVPSLVVHPALGDHAGGEAVEFTGDEIHAEKAGTHMVIKATGGFAKTATSGSKGPVEITAALGDARTVDLVIGFGHSRAEAEAAADGSLSRGYDKVLASYEAGWETYLGKLTALPDIAKEGGDGGKLAYVSAMVLKAQEDKLHPGALIASLSTPWGDTVPAGKPSTGYKAVWPRDFYQCAMALLALGDKETPLKALDYLKTVQVRADTKGNRGATGWFLQKTHVDGVQEWIGVQLDQTAMPIMLAWKLHQAGLLDDAALAALYRDELKPAADFLADGGTVSLGWNKAKITPPATQQERWEEQPGFSPSTTAAEIAGLIVASDIAASAGDTTSSAHYRDAADHLSSIVEKTMASTQGAAGKGETPLHFVRIAPKGLPDAHDKLLARNGKAALAEEDFLDAGFLELVRYGVRAADDKVIAASLAQLDDQTLPDELRVKYTFHFAGEIGEFPGWRRYGNDGYGEDTASGANFDAKPEDRLAKDVDSALPGGQRGRVWPIFTGERGHYALALVNRKPGGATDSDIAAIRGTYARAMELFANQGMMVPEQVWDGVGSNPNHFAPGAGTGSATPLNWAHAEYVKLLRSLHDRAVWDLYPPVAERFQKVAAASGGVPGR